MGTAEDDGMGTTDDKAADLEKYETKISGSRLRDDLRTPERDRIERADMGRSSAAPYKIVHFGRLRP